MSESKTRLEELRRRVELNPASPAFAALAEAYRKVGQFDEAIATARTGLERFPTYLSARVTLGRSLIELNELEEARTHLEDVVSQAPENLAAIRALADIHRRLEEPTEDTEVDVLTAVLDEQVGGDESRAAEPAPAGIADANSGSAVPTGADGPDSTMSGEAELDALLGPLMGAPDEATASSGPADGGTNDDLSDLDALLTGVADIGGGAYPETGTTTAGEEMTDLASVLVQGAETPPPAPEFAVPPSPPLPPVDPTEVSAAEPEALDLAPEALDEDPRVVAGLQRFLDAVVARRAGRRKPATD